MIEWYYLTITAAIFLGASTVIEKYALKREHATVFTGTFLLITALGSLVLLPFASFNFGLGTWIALYLLGLLLAITYLLLAKVYRHGYISVASAMTSAIPSLFVVLLGFVFLGELLQWFQYASIAVLVVASYVFLTKYNKDERDSKGRGVRFADKLLAASLIIAIGYIFAKYLLTSGLNPITYVVLTQIFAAVNILIYIGLKFGEDEEVITNLKHNAKPLIAIGLLTVAYRVPLYLSLNATKASLAVPLLNAVLIVITVMIGGLVFKEGNLWKKIAISAILVVASYFLIL